jgi:hypothetical protein
MAAQWTLLLLLSLTTPAFAASTSAEPSASTPEPNFVTDTWPRNRPIECDDRRARYIAKIILDVDRRRVHSSGFRQSLDEGPHSQRLSQAQREFLADDRGMRTWRHQNLVQITLFAVSEDDAKIMARALLDYAAAQAGEERAEFQRRLEESKAAFEQRKAELSEKEKRFEEVERLYQQSRESLHPHLPDEEVAQLARELIFQMDKEGNTLDIELAGARAKLQIIEEYLQRRNTTAVRERLEALKIDQMIELGGLDARREAVEKVRTAEQGLYSLYAERKQLQQTLPGWRDDVQLRQRNIEQQTAELEETSGRLVPPQEEERKVTIYPI